MKRILAPIAAMSIVGACTSNTAIDAIPEIEVTSFVSYALQENGDVILSGSDGDITIPAADLANFATLSGGAEQLVIAQWSEHYVRQSSDNVAVAAGSTLLGEVFTPEAIFVGYGGIAGETVVTPTSGSTEYQGTWAAVAETDHNDVHTEWGDLTLSHSFEGNSITGTGNLSGGSTQVLSIEAIAGAGGDITGTVTFDGYGPDYIRTGNLTAGFFGAGAAEIAGVFIGEGIAGTMLAERQPEMVVVPE